MKTWQVFALVAGIVGVGWLLFRRRAGSTGAPGTYTDGSLGGGPPASTTSLSQSPTPTPASAVASIFSHSTPATFLDDLYNAAGAIYKGANSGALTPQQVADLQQQLIAFNAANGGVAPSTGPATESLSGRGHF